MKTARSILITRAEPEASRTSKRLKSMGFSSIILPAIEIISSPTPALDLNFDGALIFTSQNGVRYAPSDLNRNVRATFCVGDATAHAAKEAGFTHIHSAQGSSIELKSYILKTWHRLDGPLLHLSNPAPKGKLVVQLKAEGYHVRQLTIYQSVPNPEFSSQFNEMLETDTLPDCILVYSPSAARILSQTLKDASPAKKTNPLTILTISPDTGNILLNIPNSRVFFAPKPNENSLLEQLKLA